MIFLDVNWVAILVSGIASMVVGYLWYSPFLFGNSWMKLMGFTKNSMSEAMKKGMAKSYGMMFVGSLLMAYVLSHLLFYVQAETVSEGVTMAIWIWAGFVAPVMLSSALFEGKPWKLFLINVGYQLVNLAVAGGILAVMG